MHRLLLLLTLLLGLTSCSDSTAPGGGGGGEDAAVDGGGDPGPDAARAAPDASSAADSGSAADAGSSGPDAASLDASIIDAGLTCPSPCPAGSSCGSANGIPVCRAASGIPLFTHVFVIVMENTSYATLDQATNTPNLTRLKKSWATASNYHGVAHPSLGNYIALASGGTQGIACDCTPVAGTACSTFNCNLAFHGCGCNKPALSIADQLELAGKSWTAYGEGMGAATPCRLTDDTATKYAVRHLPFLYFDGIQSDAARCRAHVVDFSRFAVDAAAPAFSFVAPNLDHDMHDPFPAGAQNLANGDAFIGPLVDSIVAGDAMKGGLLVVVWDEDDNSGGVTGSDDPIPMFVISPLAKGGGYVGPTKADHYALLATIEDGLGLPRLGKAATAAPLSEYFPAK